MVNTFITAKCFKKSAQLLDNTRLWKQVIEAKTILNIITNSLKSWANHPAVNQWRGYEDCLKYYYNCHLDEWVQRGFKNNTQTHYPVNEKKITYPYWAKSDIYINSHKASLLRKNPSNYETKFTDIPEVYLTRGYFWPSKHTKSDHDKKKIEDLLEVVGDGTKERCKGKNKDGKKCEFRAKKQGFCMRHFNSQ